MSAAIETPPRATSREWIGLAVLALPCLLYSMDLTVLNLAVPPGSPSSLKRYCWPTFQAQQLCVALGSLAPAMKAWASAALVTGAARAIKRLLRISSRYSQGASRVKAISLPRAG